MIFSLVVDWVLNQTMDQPRGLQWTFAKTLEDLNFADDIVLLSQYFKHIQEKSQRLSTVANRTRDKHPENKEHEGQHNYQHTHPNRRTEDVESFTYLASIISKTGGTDEDIKSKIGKARHVFVTLKSVWNNWSILLKTSWPSSTPMGSLFCCTVQRHGSTPKH